MKYKSVISSHEESIKMSHFYQQLWDIPDTYNRTWPMNEWETNIR